MIWLVLWSQDLILGAFIVVSSGCVKATYVETWKCMVQAWYRDGCYLMADGRLAHPSRKWREWKHAQILTHKTTTLARMQDIQGAAKLCSCHDRGLFCDGTMILVEH